MVGRLVRPGRPLLRVRARPVVDGHPPDAGGEAGAPVTAGPYPTTVRYSVKVGAVGYTRSNGTVVSGYWRG